MPTKRTNELTLADRLSRLTYDEACKALGERGKLLLQRGGVQEIDIAEQVSLSAARLEVRFTGRRDRVVVARRPAAAFGLVLQRVQRCL
jgi:hypothetical protein